MDSNHYFTAIVLSACTFQTLHTNGYSIEPIDDHDFVLVDGSFTTSERHVVSGSCRSLVAALFGREVQLSVRPSVHTAVTIIIIVLEELQQV